MSQDEKRKDGVKSGEDRVKKNRVRTRTETSNGYPEDFVHPVRKKNRERRDIAFQQEESDGSVKRMMQHDLEVFSWGDVPMQNPDAVQERCVKYLNLCFEDDIKPTIAGLALALGIDRLTLLRYREGILGKSEEVRSIIKRASDFITSQMEAWFASGKINPIAGIFLMKNNMQYRDQTEILVNQTAPLGQDPDQKQLEEKYLNSIVLNEDEIEKHMDND